MTLTISKRVIKKLLSPLREIRIAREKERNVKEESRRNIEIQKLIAGDYYFSHRGYCVCCETEVTFEARDSWLRDSYFCMNCRCKPRERALMHTIETYYPNWKNLSIHESSPIKRGASVKLRKYCTDYLASQYYPTKEFGSIVNGFRNEDLGNQTFADESFDLVVTSDVMEHVYDPEKVFKEVARTLKRGGAHIFTVPIINRHMKTEVWATLEPNGEPNFLKTPEFHGNPVDKSGSPVTMHWGFDIIHFISKVSGLETDIIDLYDKNFGVMGEYNEVFVSRRI